MTHDEIKIKLRDILQLNIPVCHEKEAIVEKSLYEILNIIKCWEDSKIENIDRDLEDINKELKNNIERLEKTIEAYKSHVRCIEILAKNITMNYLD